MNKPMNFSAEDKKTVKKFATFLLSLTPNEFGALASLIGFLLSQDLDFYAQQSAGNFFECIGQVMLTISAQGFTRQQDLNNKNNNNIPF